MSLRSFNQTLTIAGTVVGIDLAVPSFSVEARSGDKFEAVVGRETYYSVLSNLDGLDRNRVPPPEGVSGDDSVIYNLQKYAVAGRPLSVRGIYQQNDGRERFEARDVYLLHSDPQRYLFEETHWWPTQMTQMADRILDHLFDAKRSYTIDDFSEFYRTNLNILGQATDETVQECAVLSRLLYDSVVRLSDDWRRTLPDGGARGGELPARGVPQPQSRRALLLLGLRPPAQHTGRARRVSAVRLARPGRPRDNPALRANLRARRSDAVLPYHPGLGGAGGHPTHHQQLPGFLLGPAVGARRRASPAPAAIIRTSIRRQCAPIR